jgi:hypothetical protein
MMSKTRVSLLTLAGLIGLAACSESGGPAPEPGLVVLQGNNQSAPANTFLPTSITISVRDAAGTPVGAGQQVTFSIVAGGGALSGSPTQTTDASGTVTAPGWRLGKRNVTQTMRASFGGIDRDIDANVATLYNIEVRYFGDPMSAAHQALFENAAARLEGIITGDVVNASANSNLAEDCAAPGDPPVAGLPTVNEEVDDIIVYATLATIDGSGAVLAHATPCLGRDTPVGTMVAYGYMKFDIADISAMSATQGEEVITHEMLHILGSGTLWETDRALISGKGGADPRFLGPLARQACAALGAIVTCANTVPLENVGGTGSRDFHWRESTFNNELMTSGYNSGTNPISTMTIASMADLGFVVNNADFDNYTFIGTYVSPSQIGTAAAAHWEQLGTLRGMLRPGGRVERIRR